MDFFFIDYGFKSNDDTDEQMISISYQIVGKKYVQQANIIFDPKKETVSVKITDTGTLPLTDEEMEIKFQGHKGYENNENNPYDEETETEAWKMWNLGFQQSKQAENGE